MSENQNTAGSQLKQKYFHVNDIAVMFGVSRPTIYEWMKKDLLKYFTIAGKRFCTQEQIDALSRTNDLSKKVCEGNYD